MEGGGQAARRGGDPSVSLSLSSGTRELGNLALGHTPQTSGRKYKKLISL